MSKRRKFSIHPKAIVGLVILIVVVLLVQRANAQADAWQVTLYDGTQFVHVTAAGIENVALPEAVRDLAIFTGGRNVSLSSDGSILAFVEQEMLEGGNFRATLKFANLQTDACCVVAEHPLEVEPDTIVPGPFSPDSTEIVVSYSRQYSQQDFSMAAAATIDVATGAIRSSLPVDTFEAGILFLESWDEDGIVLRGSCICDDFPGGQYSLWNPMANTFDEQAVFIPPFSDTLALTGEVVMVDHDTLYPIANNYEGLLPPFNVIKYQAGLVAQADVIFFSEDAVTLTGPSWVLDGAAYITQNISDNMGVLVFRDGTQHRIDFGQPVSIIAGTPDGWLVYTWNDHILYHYTMQDGQPVAESLGELSPNFLVLDSPDLGATAVSDVVPVGEVNRSRPNEGTLYAADVRTGDAMLDTVIDAVLNNNAFVTGELLEFVTIGCTPMEGLGGPPKCDDGMAEGTPVTYFPILFTHGAYLTEEEAHAMLPLVTTGLYALYRVPDSAVIEPEFPAGEFALVFAGACRPNFCDVFTLRVADGKIVRMDAGISDPRLLPEGITEGRAGEFLLPPLAGNA